MQPHYLTYIDYPNGQRVDGPSSFADAYEAYRIARNAGAHATVMRIEPGKGNGAGMALDVTSDAIQRIARVYANSRSPFPKWLKDEMQEA